MENKDAIFYAPYTEGLEQIEKTMVQELETELHNIPQEEYTSTPAEYLKSRIKSADSMCEKLRKHGYAETAENALTCMSDAVGVRVITHFVGDVYAVLEQTKKATCWKVVQVKDYIAVPKPNGYRSLHIIVELPFPSPIIPTIRAEIQLRTIAMDCWASLEHQMKYKKHIQNADLIESELYRCANEMASTDLTMQAIREMIQAEQSADTTEEG